MTDMMFHRVGRSPPYVRPGWSVSFRGRGGGDVTRHKTVMRLMPHEEVEEEAGRYLI
jgi:hypothetical protein